jgi:predicted RNA-binding protein with PUA-like domain
MKGLGYSTISKAYRVWNLTNGTLEEVHDVEFDETQGSQNKAQNLDDVRGDQLTNAMRNMDIGDVRLRQVDDDDDIHVINQSVQIDTNQASSSGYHDEAQDQGQASKSNQLPILQTTSIARDHPLDQIIGGIQSGVQTRSRLTSFCEHYLFISLEEPKKIEDALKDSNWVNAMHEELNNFTRN